jgi:hypothetical protein
LRKNERFFLRAGRCMMGRAFICFFSKIKFQKKYLGSWGEVGGAIATGRVCTEMVQSTHCAYFKLELASPSGSSLELVARIDHVVASASASCRHLVLTSK